MNNNYIEYESNGARNKSLSLEEYLDKIRPYLMGYNNWSSRMWHMENSVSNGS